MRRVIKTFRMSPSEARESELVALAEGCTVSELIRMLVRERAESLARKRSRGRSRLLAQREAVTKDA